MGHAIKCIRIKHEVNDNTKPSARMGRKAYRVSKRQPGCRNAILVSAPAFCCSNSCKKQKGEFVIYVTEINIF